MSSGLSDEVLLTGQLIAMYTKFHTGFCCGTVSHHLGLGKWGELLRSFLSLSRLRTKNPP
jgi:hypothetical protein